MTIDDFDNKDDDADNDDDVKINIDTAHKSTMTERETIGGHKPECLNSSP